MPSTLGIQVQIKRGPDQSIARMPAARTAFVGRTLRGPVNRPVLIKAFAEFHQIFGGLWQPSPLSYAVEHFFDNGGREALIVRVVNGARCATVDLRSGAETLRLRASRPGTREFLRVCVDYDGVAAGDEDSFNLTIQRVRMPGSAHVEDQEIFRGLSLRADSKRHVPAVLAESKLIELDSAVPRRRPEPTIDPASGLSVGYVNSNADGDDGAPLSDYDLIGSAVERSGLFALEASDYFNLLYVPPLARDSEVGTSTLLVAARFARDHRAMLIVDPPRHWETADDALRELREYELAGEDGLMFLPRILAHDKLRGRFESFAPGGAVAGMLAKGDQQAPLGSSPGSEEPVLRPGYRPSCLITDDRRARLAALGVNTLQAVRPAVGSGLRLRTLASARAGAADWRYLTARRLALYIVGSIERGTRWIAAVPLAQRSRAEELLAAQVRTFFEKLHAAGAFGERSREDSFYVVVDRRLNQPGQEAPQGYKLLIGFAAERLGEYHSYRISHSASASEVHQVTLNRLHLQLSAQDIEWVDRLAGELRQ